MDTYKARKRCNDYFYNWELFKVRTKLNGRLRDPDTDPSKGARVPPPFIGARLGNVWEDSAGSLRERESMRQTQPVRG